jgi:hypothetical protein
VPVSGASGLILNPAGGSFHPRERRAAPATAYGTARPGFAPDAEPGLLFPNAPAHPPSWAWLAASSQPPHPLIISRERSSCPEVVRRFAHEQGSSL